MKNYINLSNDLIQSKFNKKQLQHKIKELIKRKEKWDKEYSTINPILEDRLALFAEELAAIEIQLGQKISNLAKNLLFNKINTVISQQKSLKKECILLNKQKKDCPKVNKIGLNFYLDQKRYDIQILGEVAEDLKKKLSIDESLRFAA